MKISNLSANDLGDYIGIITEDPDSALSSCNEYRELTPTFWLYTFEIFPAVVLYYSIERYSKCDIVIVMLIAGLTASLNCFRITTGYPYI